MKNNVGAIEQLLSVCIGGGLMLSGLTQGRKSGAVSFLVGSGLLIHGLSSHSRLYEAMGIDETHGFTIRHPLNRTVHFSDSIIINSSPAEIYACWRDFKNLPLFMQNIIKVEELDRRHSRWQARGPMDKDFYWEAEIVEEHENEMIKWRTIESESNLEHEGTFSLRPAPGNRGTILQLNCRWSPPGGIFGAAAAKILPQDPARQVGEDLRRFRQLIETGEITRNHETTSASTFSRIAEQARGVSDELGITYPVETSDRV
ncbi:SRPBCC family protein [Candidatus Nitrospira salsa]|nr:MAG: hypothetical protein NPIRA01_11820 [Nitrospirales bacterium]